MWNGALKNHLLRFLLGWTIALLFFSYGVATVSLHVFPYTILRNAGLALDALLEVYRLGGRSRSIPARATGEEQPVTAEDDVIVPVVHNGPARPGEELILVSGGPNHLKTLSNGHGCLAWVMDRTGDVRHVWQYDPHTWHDPKNVTVVPGGSVFYPVGLHLEGDGSLLVSFQGESCFPFAVGLAKFDRHSRLIWKKERFHHWFAVGEDGRIVAPSVRVVKSPVPIGRTRAKIVSSSEAVMSDMVAILDRNGNLIEEISILKALEESGWVGLFQGSRAYGADLANVNTEDPTHLNDVRLVDRQLAARCDLLAPGDLLVSLRNINAVGILDAKTWLFKWMSVGRTLRAHSPRFFQDGILMLDNLGGSEEQGGSRLVRIDLHTGMPETLFPQPSAVLPDRFFTESAGHLDINNDGRRVLVALTHKTTTSAASSTWRRCFRTLCSSSPCGIP